MFWYILRTQGIRPAVNYAAERACMVEIKRMHRVARQQGHNLVAPNYKSPYWFNIASKIEKWTRP